jgi:hypothetical protein
MQGLENLGQYSKIDSYQVCFGDLGVKQFLLPGKVNLNGSGFNSKFVGYYPYQTGLLYRILSLFHTDIKRFFCCKGLFNILNM